MVEPLASSAIGNTGGSAGGDHHRHHARRDVAQLALPEGEVFGVQPLRAAVGDLALP